MIYFIKKVINLILTLFLVSLITFFIFHILPGDPCLVILGPDADSKQIDIMKQNLHFDNNLVKRYLNWIFDFIKGDFGKSIRFNKDVKEIILTHLKITLLLTFVVITLILLISLFFGFLILKFYNSFFYNIILIFVQIWLSLPIFCLGIILSLIFGVIFSIFPVNGYVAFNENYVSCLKSLFLPGLTLAIGNSALIIKFLMNSFIEQLQMDYVMTAKSRGLSNNVIKFKHILKNSILSIITILGMIIVDIIGGSIIVENIFSISGIGSLIVMSILSRDFPLLQSLTLCIVFFVVIINFIIDMLYKLIDPRIKI